ncbi:MAG: hypothetical protein LBV09_01865 [Deferribacteraceae bacterium]|jgi:hypothetical protein|nr:hypothetical protein [Deferribacteraceae bacterium]
MLSLRKFLVVLLSLGALALFAACAGEDGDNGKAGAASESALNSRAATGAECPDGEGTVYFLTDNNVLVPGSEQIVCAAAGAGEDQSAYEYPKLGTNSCAICHEGSAFEFATDAFQDAEVSGGVVADDNAEKERIGGGVHFADSANRGLNYENPNNSVEGCGVCHDDGSLEENMILAEMFGLPPLKNASPATCTSCHGAEPTGTTFGDHYATPADQTFTPKTDADAVYPLADASLVGTGIQYSANFSSTFTSCAACHGGQHDDRVGNYFNTDNLLPQHTALGSHGYVIDHPNDNTINYFGALATGNIPAGRAICAVCHTATAAAAYNTFTGSKSDDEIVAAAAYLDTEDDDAIDLFEAAVGGANMSATPLGCATCHNAHTGGLVTKGDVYQKFTFKDVDLDGAGEGEETEDFENEMLVYSKEYILCTSCHVVKLDVVQSLAYDDADHSGTQDAGEYFEPSEILEYYLDGDVYNTMVVGEEPNSDAGHHIDEYFMNFAASHFATAEGEKTMTSFAATDPNQPWLGGTVGAMSETKGFGVWPNSSRACTSCHNPHSTSKFGEVVAGGVSGEAVTKDGVENIAQTWAASAHGAQGGHFNGGNYAQKRCAPCHDGGNALKFMKNGARAAFASNVELGMQTQVDGNGNAVMCATCHDLDTLDAANSGTITGKLRTVVTTDFTVADDPRTAAENDAITVNGWLQNAGGYGNTKGDALATYILNNTIPTANISAKSLVCLTCHSGGSRGTVAGTAATGGNAWTRVQQFNSGAATVYANSGAAALHRAEGAVATGLGYISVKTATDTSVALLSDLATASTLPVMDTGTMTHSKNNLEYTCVGCHDVSATSHSFRTANAATGSCAPCHTAVDGSKTNTYGVGVTAATKVLTAKNGAAKWTVTTDMVGKKYAIAGNMAALAQDKAPWAHGGNKAKEAIGQSLKAIYLGDGNADDAATFYTWIGEEVAANYICTDAACGNYANY